MSKTDDRDDRDGAGGRVGCTERRRAKGEHNIDLESNERRSGPGKLRRVTVSVPVFKRYVFALDRT